MVFALPTQHDFLIPYQSRSERITEAYIRLSQWPGIAPLDAARDRDIYRELQEKRGRPGAYSSCFGYHLQAARGTPLRYYDGENLVTFGFQREGMDVVAIGPLGTRMPEILAEIGRALLPLNIAFCVRKVEHDHEAYSRNGFRSVAFASEDFPYLSALYRPDDFFSEVAIDLRTPYLFQSFPPQVRQKLRQEIHSQLLLKAGLTDVNAVLSDMLGPRPLDTLEWYEAMLDLSYGRTSGLGIDRGGIQFQSLRSTRLDLSTQEELRAFVREWARARAGRETFPAVSDVEEPAESTDALAEAYEPILAHMPDSLSGRLGLARDENGNLVGFVYSERSAPQTRSLLINLSQPRPRNLSLALLVSACEAIQRQEPDVFFLNLGGSETEDLHRFKCQLGRVLSPTNHYLRYVGESATTQSRLFSL